MLTEEQAKRLDELVKKIDKADDIDVLSEAEQEEYFVLTSQVDADERYNELPEIEAEAFDRVWFDRSSIGTDAEKPGISEEIRQKALEAQQRIIEQYQINPEDCDDFYHGYWSGILALCRYLSGFYDVDIEDLRTGDCLLDT